ncbi:MucR family transcriptional regulator [Sphingobium sp. Z007]|uniref:MucR family transcriptional regulator n=1 Tax=Sphingobium sp. Z007 TaxID=627495 RepID=UPI0020CCD3CB|nr:MucR family transcriptional regulator [Sphingobium sp. Z007]
MFGNVFVPEASISFFLDLEFSMSDAIEPDFTAMTVQLLSAYFANNQVPASDIPGIIETTRTALERKTAVATPAEPDHVPAVSIRKSLASRDHIISLIDGKPYKSLKRHIGRHGLTPAEYRERYNLAKDYPMVAPGYSEQRREVAQRLGLGRKKVNASDVPVAAEPETPVAAAPAKRGRKPSRADAATSSGKAENDIPVKGKPGRKPRAKPGTESVAEAPAPAPVVKANRASIAAGAKQHSKPKTGKRVTKANASELAVKTAPEADPASV